MDEERQKKIEAGKLELAKFKKKKRKNSKKLTEGLEMPETEICDTNENVTSHRHSPCGDIMEEDEMTASSHLDEDALDEEDLLNLPVFANKIQMYQEKIQKRDVAIEKLSSRLNSGIEKQDAANTEVEHLKKEIDDLRLQIQKINSDIILREKEKIDSYVQENLERLEGTQTETGTKSTANISIQTFMSDESRNDKSHSDEASLLKLDNLVREKSQLQAQVRKLTNCLINARIIIPNESESNPSASLQVDTHAKVYVNRLLKKLVALNTVAKLVDSLLGISSNLSSIAEFSPSKFQRQFLKRMNSHETSESLTDTSTISECENTSSDTVNYAEVEIPFSQSILNSVEKLRNVNLSKDFSNVTEFLQVEKENICSEFEVSAQFLMSSDFQGCVSSVITDLTSGQGLSTDSSKEVIETTYQKIEQEKNKLEGRLQYFIQLERKLQESEQDEQRKSMESDNLICSEDNLLMEQPALSCLSLISLTDSESRIEFFNSQAEFTDSETSISRKMSFCTSDGTRSNQEREICFQCERMMFTVKEKQDEILILNERLTHCEMEVEEKFKNLESEKQLLILGKEAEMSKQIELLCKENEMRLQQLVQEHSNEMEKLSYLSDKCHKEKDEALSKVKALNDDLSALSKRISVIIEEKANNEFRLQNEIADLVQDHQQDLESFEKNKLDFVNLEKKKMEKECLTSIELLKKVHQDELENFKHSLTKEHIEKENILISEHSKSMNMIETERSEEIKEYQKRIEHLLEEKCNLLNKTSQDYERILQKNHKTLVNLCTQLLSQIREEKERINTDRDQKDNLEASFSDTLNNLSLRIENGINKFLNVNYFANGTENFFEDETQYIDLESKSTANSTLMEEQIENAVLEQKNLKESQNQHDSSFNFDDFQKLHFEMNRLQADFENDIATYKGVNQELSDQVQSLNDRILDLEDQKKKLEQKLDESEKVLAEKEIQSSTNLNHAAQTNSRLLHVLSDLVKTFLDIENEINNHLLEHGLIPSHAGNLAHHDDETGQNVGSREDFSSLCLGEGPNIDLTEDGPDLTPRAWDLFSTLGTYDVDTEGEDVVLGASRRLRLAVDHVLNLLTRSIQSQQSHDLKVLLKRNEELSEELQHESQTRDSVHYELLNAKAIIRKHEMEKQNLEDQNAQLTDSQSQLEKELCAERNRLSRLAEEKDMAIDDIHTLKEQIEVLASRLGDPEKKLLQENSKLCSEKQIIQKHHSKERQSLLDRLHQMEQALDELTAEKDEILEKKCREIEDLKAEMESMEKQCQSNKKFIEEQTLEREQEREEFIKELHKLQEFIHEKEKIQSNEEQLYKEIENSEMLLRNSMEDRKNAMAKKDETEKELRQAMEKIRDLRDIIEELEKQLENKAKIEDDLKQKLLKVCESASAQEKSNLSLKERLEESQTTTAISCESMEQLRHLEEQLASRSEEMEQMSQSMTLLHELRGQIHFLEAKVDHRAKQLESGQLPFDMSPVHSDATSQSESQDGRDAALHILPEDGWEMSPRSVHWLEMRHLEEKITRLMQIDEELIRRNRELESQLRKIREEHEENHHENVALREKLSEQLLEISALRSHLDEQKHRIPTYPIGPTVSEIEELRNCFEMESEKNKRTALELQDAQDMLKNFQEQLKEKDRAIVVLQKNSALLSKKLFEEKDIDDFKTAAVSSNDSGESISRLNLMILEKNEHIDSLERELEELQNEHDKIKNDDSKASMFLTLEQSQAQLVVQEEAFEQQRQENRNLRERVHQLESEVLDLQSAIKSAEEQIELGKVQVETLLLEMGNCTSNPIEKNSKPAANAESTNSQTETNTQQHLAARLKLCEAQLKKKNLENLTLKSTVAELEKTLEATERELLFEQQRLGQDFNTVQDMVSQKERELQALQEESDAQLKLESKLESLEQALSDQKIVEEELRMRSTELEASLVEREKFSEKEREHFEAQMKECSKKHLSEVGGFKKRVQILSQKLKELLNGEENIDMAQLRNQLVEAADAFRGSDAESREAFGELVYSCLKQAVDIKLNELLKKHETDINTFNQHWQEHVKKEVAKHANDFLNKYNKDLEIVKLDKDSFWQQKLKDVETSLETKWHNSQLETSKKLDTLNTDNRNLSQEISALQKHNQDLKTKEQAMVQFHDREKDYFLKEFQVRLQAAEDQMKTKYIQQKQQLEAAYRGQVDRLQAELTGKLEAEKHAVEVEHKEELNAVHKFFEQRWEEEIRKFHALQMEDMKKVKDNKDKNMEAVCGHLMEVYEDKLKKIRNECETQIIKDRKARYIQHQEELQHLQKLLEDRFVAEKQIIVSTKNKELQQIREELEKQYDKKLLERREFLSLPANMDAERKNWRTVWERERSELVANHRVEIAELERLWVARWAEKEAEMSKAEETFGAQLEDARKLLKEANRMASLGSQSNSGSRHRMSTPTSDVTTSSDETCSSCREDILPGNKNHLVNKIHQDGKQVLSLIESRQKSASADIKRLLKERECILHQLKDLTLVPHEKSSDLMLIISHLVQEIKSSRKELERIAEKETEIQQQFSQLRHQISVQSSKNHELVSHLLNQKKINEDLDTLLNITKSELQELKDITSSRNREEKSTLKNQMEYRSNFHMSGDGSGTRLSEEAEVIRSADTQRSGNGLSMFLPDISPFQKGPEHFQQPRWEESLDLPIAVPSRLLDEKISPMYSTQVTKDSVPQNVHTPNGKSVDGTIEAKFHCLFWRYKRSQSYQKALAYQKKYLLSLLKGFQATEKATLSWLQLMGSRPDGEAVPRGRSLFRAVAFALVAVARMRFLVRFWRQRARLPASSVLHSEVERVVQDHPFALLSGGQFMSSNFSSSKSVSVDECGSLYRMHHNSTDSRSRGENQRKRMDNSQLIEYVNRLETLHQQLGLQEVLSAPLATTSISSS